MTAIDKLKALLDKQNGGEERSHKLQTKRPEGETPDIYDKREYTTNWRKHDIDDRDQDDKDYYYN